LRTPDHARQQFPDRGPAGVSRSPASTRNARNIQHNHTTLPITGVRVTGSAAALRFIAKAVLTGNTDRILSVSECGEHTVKAAIAAGATVADVYVSEDLDDSAMVQTPVQITALPPYPKGKAVRWNLWILDAIRDELATFAAERWVSPSHLVQELLWKALTDRRLSGS
jgi:hypothetical protein